jgi:hypothetical protein
MQLLASCQEGLCLILSLLLTAISDSFRDMQEQLNNSLHVNIEGKGSSFSTWISFAELYNENVFDLLEPIGTGRQKRRNLALGVDNKGQVYIKGKTFVIKMLERFVAYCLHGDSYLQYFFLFMFVCEHLCDFTKQKCSYVVHYRLFLYELMDLLFGNFYMRINQIT